MRRGFTLVELMIVIVIIGILVALFMPAIKSVVNRTSDSAVAAEIQGLSTALENFKADFGCYPPSRIVFSEDGDFSDSRLGQFAPLKNRSLSYLRRIWPRVDFKTDGTKPKIAEGWYDLNGNHKKDDPYVVYGNECLVLFLGGIAMGGDTDSWGVTGFDKNPKNPFTSAAQPPTSVSWPYGEGRTKPYFDFRGSRLFWINNPAKDAPGGGMLITYGDYYGNDSTFAYFSGYEGVGYDPDDCNFKEEGQWNYSGYTAQNSATPESVVSRIDVVRSPGPNPYCLESPVALDSNGGWDSTQRRSRVFPMKTKYQIISSGRDRLFGIGGAWIEKGLNRTPFAPLANQQTTNQTLSNDFRSREGDNITNFAAGILQ